MAAPLLSCSLDSQAIIEAAPFNGVVTNASFPGEGVQIDANGEYITFPLDGTHDFFRYGKGALSVWFKPLGWNSWDYLASASRYFIRIKWSASQYFYLRLMPVTTGNYLNAYFDPSGRANGSVMPYQATQWTNGTWHKLSVFWDLAHCYVIVKIDDQFGTLGTGAAVTPDAISDASIRIGNVGGGTSPALGILKDLNIYADPADILTLPVGQDIADLNATYNPHTPASVQPVLDMLADTEVMNNFDKYPNALCPILDAGFQPGENVFFFERPAYELTYENYVPPTGDIKSTINYQVPKGEEDWLFFGVYTRIDLTSCAVALGAGGFSGPTTIAKANCDLRIIQNWFQGNREKGTNCDSFPYYLPGCFLKNDQINGNDPSDGTRLDENTSLTQLVLPLLPLDADVSTEIEDHTCRMFALKIPKINTAGNYTATITLTADGGVSESLTLNLTVLNFTLQSGNFDRYFLNGKNLWDTTMGLEAWDELLVDLADIKSMGGNSVWLWCTGDGTDALGYFSPHPTLGAMTYAQVVTEKIRICREVFGFERVFVNTDASQKSSTTKDWQMEDAITAMLAYDYEPWIYGYDELGIIGTDYSKLRIQISQILAAQAFYAGVKFITTGSRSAVLALQNAAHACYTEGVDPRTGNPFPEGTYTPLDACFYGLADAYTTSAFVDGPDPSLQEGIYWQCRDFAHNRYEFGYGPYLRGFGLVVGYGRSDSGFYYTMYNDCDSIDGSPPYYRPYGFAYPAVKSDGSFHIIPSHRGEVIRAGIQDYKLLKTWEYYHDRAVASGYSSQAAASQTVINNLLVKYDGTSTAGGIQPSHRVSQTQYATDRAAIIEEIGELMDLRLEGRSYINNVSMPKFCGKYITKFNGVIQ